MFLEENIFLRSLHDVSVVLQLAQTLLFDDCHVNHWESDSSAFNIVNLESCSMLHRRPLSSLCCNCTRKLFTSKATSLYPAQWCMNSICAEGYHIRQPSVSECIPTHSNAFILPLVINVHYMCSQYKVIFACSRCHEC